MLNDVRNNGNGIVYSTVELALEQAKLGAVVAVASGGGGFTSELDAGGVRHFRLQQRGLRSLLASVFRLGAILEEFKPDVVHCHMVAGVLLTRAARLGRLRQQPLLVAHVRNTWMRHSKLMRAADHAIAISQGAALAMAKMGFKPSRTTVIHNGTLRSPIRALRSGDLDGGHLKEPCVVTVCGIYERKGIYDLVEAASLLRGPHPELQFYLVGHGDDLVTLKSLIALKGLGEHFTLVGFKPNVYTYLKQATVFVLASHDEPFGRVLLEAREAGAPIVATAVGGIPEATDNGRCAVLVPPKNPARLAEAIGDLLMNPGKRKALVAAGMENLDYWTVERVAREVLDLYIRLQARR